MWLKKSIEKVQEESSTSMTWPTFAIRKQPAAKYISSHSDKTLAYNDIRNARLLAEVFLISVTALRRIDMVKHGSSEKAKHFIFLSLMIQIRLYFMQFCFSRASVGIQSQSNIPSTRDRIHDPNFKNVSFTWRAVRTTNQNSAQMLILADSKNKIDPIGSFLLDGILLEDRIKSMSSMV